ncbi:DUF2987 domain-containing protein [Thalassotalea sp. ND16A]|uniref:DUF2987 domain-containing protein n=1 Tax=Thalassotalea sp. ND16A TaxID=1535422 RepID=UPI00051A3C0F|nr:DUF2987 domain-containing protein [Thalassotalea sp. ND16A]KGK01616.1 hypothetical protein ND16A_2965 [Thalassotalea sp. ND16A]
MKKFLFALSVSLLAITSFSSLAVDLEYKGFYQRLDLIKENKLEKITMGFYLVDSYKRTRCEMEKATMLAQGTEPSAIAIADDGQLLVPYSRDLYDKFALLRVKLKDEYQNCILQMQMQVKDKTKSDFSFAELALITTQMQQLVDEFGSFLWFMMPQVSGLHIELSSPENIAYINEKLKPALVCEQEKCKLAIDADNQSNDKAISFDLAPKLISPWINKE